MVGYQPGYGVVKDEYPQDASGTFTRLRLLVMVGDQERTTRWSPPPSARTTNSARTSAAATRQGSTCNWRLIWAST